MAAWEVRDRGLNPREYSFQYEIWADGNCIAKGLNKRDAEAEVEHHNYVIGLQVENERLRKALNDAAGTGLMIYHIAKEHAGRARDCQELSCGLQRRTMEGFVNGPIVWGD